MQAKFGIIEIPRSIDSARENARLAEEHGFDIVGVACLLYTSPSPRD